MGLIAKKGGDEEERPTIDLQLERLVCPTCRREVEPWQRRCPDDGTPVVSRTEVAPSTGPTIPAHLLEGLDEPEPPEG